MGVGPTLDQEAGRQPFEGGPGLGLPCARRAQSTPAEFKNGQIVRRVAQAAFSAVGLQFWLYAAVQRAPRLQETLRRDEKAMRNEFFIDRYASQKHEAYLVGAA